MRSFINAILSFIGSESLTDEEFDGLTITVYGYDQATYEAIDAVIAARDSSSNMRTRLGYYFQAKGVSITSVSQAQSNIFIGGELC